MLDYRIKHVVKEIYVDDGSITHDPAAIAYVQGGAQADTNFGGATTLIIKGDGNLNFAREGYIRFDIPYSAEPVEYAQLHLYAATQDSGTSSAQLGVYGVEEEWEEQLVTWNNKPGYDGLISSQQIGNSFDWYSFDVTAYAQQRQAEQASMSLALVQNLDFQGINVNIRNRDGFEPYLRIKYRDPVETGPVAPVWPEGSQVTVSDVSSHSVTLVWTAAEDNIGVSSYRVEWDGGQSVTVDGSVLTVTIAGLSPGALYGFKIEAGDEAGNWSADGPAVQVQTLPLPSTEQGAVLTGPETIGAGEALALTYSLVNVTSSVYAKSLNVHYDPALLQFVSAESLIDHFSVVDSVYGTGQITLIQAGLGPDSAITGSQDVLRLSFQAFPLTQSVTASVYLTDVLVSDHLGNVAELDSGTVYSVTIAAAPVVDRTELEAVIAAASEASENARVHPSLWGHYPQAAVNALNAAILAAVETLHAGSATQGEVDGAKDALTAAVQVFAAAVNATAGIGDLGVMAYHYGAVSGSPQWAFVRLYDFNGNGQLDIYDLSVMARKISE